MNGKKRHPLAGTSVALAAALLAAGCAARAGPALPTGGGPRPAAAASESTTALARTPAPCSPGTGTCWVAVNVTTLWVRPTYPRPGIDRPALTNPAHPGTWAASMTYAQKLWLASGKDGKVNTQALYGTKVKVLRRWVAPNGVQWTKVAIPSQRTPKNPRGYPGWVPARQLTSTAPAAASTTAVVLPRTARLWSRWNSGGAAGDEVMKVSYGTRLPVVRATSTYAEVTLIGGRHVAVRRSAVKLHAAGTPWGATRARLVADAKRFRGLPYLWAGTASFGYDCSGFTYSLYRAFGITLPRDAGQQARHGTPVTQHSLRPGDLVFYRGYAGGPIGHVGMYIGSGNIIDAPQTGQPVKVEPLSSHSHYAGARRYL